MFRWDTLPHSTARVCLCWNGWEVARLWQKITGPEWFVSLHDFGAGEHVRPCSSFEQGQRGTMMWAERHRDRIVSVLDRRELEWLAKQGWRGEDATEARRKLMALQAAERAQAAP